MGHPLQVWMAVLVLTGWCTAEEAELIRKRLTMLEIPDSVAGVTAQFEAAREAVRGS